MKPLLDGEPPPDDWRDAVFSQIGNTQMIRTETEKLNVYQGEAGEYYDLAKDPKEFYNRIEDERYQQRVDVLFEQVKAWEGAYGRDGG